MEGVRIRRAGVEQLEDLRPLWVALSEHHKELTPPDIPVRPAEEGWPLRREGYRRAVEEGAVLFVAEDATGAVGFALASPRPAPANLGIDRLLDVETVAVAPEVRGAGIGSALMDAVEAWAREQEIEYLQLSVRSRNEDARRLYERRGFAPLYATLVSTPDGRIRTEGERMDPGAEVMAPADPPPATGDWRDGADAQRIRRDRRHATSARLLGPPL